MRDQENERESEKKMMCTFTLLAAGPLFFRLYFYVRVHARERALEPANGMFTVNNKFSYLFYYNYQYCCVSLCVLLWRVIDFWWMADAENLWQRNAILYLQIYYIVFYDAAE